jgi:hypothetical protein
MALGEKCSWRRTRRGKVYYCTKGPNGKKADALEHSVYCAANKEMQDEWA